MLDYGTFIGLKLHKISFQACSLKDVEFSEADLTQADFRKAILTNSRFRNTNLTRADFTNASNYAIDVSHNNVEKARFSMPEAIALLHCMDIELVE